MDAPRGIIDDTPELDRHKAAKAKGLPVMEKDFSSRTRLKYLATRRSTLIGVGVASVAILGIGVAGLASKGVFDGEYNPDMRTVDVVLDDGTTMQETVDNSGTFETGSGDVVVMSADEPLPESVQASLDDGLADIDTTASNGSASVEYLGTELATSGKSYLVITPASLSCDGDTYFDGYSVQGDVDMTPMEEDPPLCQMQETLDGAHDLAALLIEKSTTATKDTVEVFEVGMNDADAIYAGEAQDAAPGDEPAKATPTKPDNSHLTADERQTFGGDIEGSSTPPPKPKIGSDPTEPDATTGK